MTEQELLEFLDRADSETLGCAHCGKPIAVGAGDFKNTIIICWECCFASDSSSH